MTKQEEIMLRMAQELFWLDWNYGSIQCENNNLSGQTDAVREGYRKRAGLLLQVLHSQGVMVKVKCPDCNWSQFGGGESVGMTPCHCCNSTGYITEPLIEEEQKHG